MRIVLLLLTICCLVYSVIVYRVGSGTFSFVIWIGAAIFWGIAYYLFGHGRWVKLPLGLRTTVCLLLSLIFVTASICMTLMVSHFGDKGEKDLDYIIVLGAQMRYYGPSIIFKYRLDAAYDYLMDNPDTICIISGAQGANEPISEGEGGRDYLIARGISSDRILAETRARDTGENIEYSLSLIEEDTVSDSDSYATGLRIGIVTNNFHVFRGMHLAMAQTEREVYGIAAYTMPLYLPNNMIRECFGILRDLPKMRL
ncbi:YdcF family protein [Butyrivibrio sp. MC2013]|uniref:YdcF family protein n=1 Tax=Butyrivibrio sp. MC2013 TaxID=1280686 RepID=UPI000563EFC5|nr:YdcF family protein [Butyrivibrio sp. MC2013]